MRRGARGARKPSPGFLRAAARTTPLVSEALLKQGRKSGSLNLANRSLEVVPSSVWHINAEPPSDRDTSFGAQDDDRWWDQVDLGKLILADNQIKEIAEDIRLLTGLAILDIHNNQLSSLPEAIGELQQLKRLILSHNELTSLPAALTSLTNLQVVKLDHNKLQALPVDMGLLVHVEELDASHNLLSRLPSSVGDMRSLHVLAVTHNHLESVPETLDSLTGLKQLSVSNNKLASLPKLLNCATALQQLYCNYNCLLELPLLQHEAGLKELHYGHNRVSKIDPDRLHRLQSLIYLDLRDNKISSVPECIVDIKTLERLDLTNNDLSSLPYVMGNMTNFKSLLLDGNPLRGLRREIVQRGTVGILEYLRSRLQTGETTEPVHHSTKFTPTKPRSNPQSATIEKDVASFSLESKKIDISKRNLTEIPQELYSNVHLSTLNVGHNKLSSISPQFSVFTCLTVLDIRSNRVSELPQELEKCSKLSDVIISCNAFTILPEVLYSLKSLETLLASDNQVGSIDVDGLLQLPMLSCLDLQNNSISQVPAKLGTVTTLKHLELGGNPFRTPRAAILAKGTGAVLEYLRDRIPT